MNFLASLLLAAILLLPAAAGAQASALVLLLEDDGRQLSLLDGDTLAPRLRVATVHALRGAPRFTSDGRFAFIADAGGGITRFDLRDLSAAARVQTGATLRDFALSADGQWLLAGTADPPALLLFDATLRERRRYPTAALDGSGASAVATVHPTGPRRSFVVGFDTLPELWEISHDPAAPPIFDGLVHDYRMGEAIATPGYLGVRRTPLQEPFTALAVDPAGQRVLGAAPQASAATAALAVIHLDVRRQIVRAPLEVTPSAPTIAGFTRQGRWLAAVAGPPGRVQVLDPADGKVLRTWSTGGPALFLATHPAAPHLWVGSEPGTLTLVDKASLEVAAVLPVAGELLGSIAFTRDGRRTLAGVRTGGTTALVVFDAATQAEVGRIPVRGPATAWSVQP